MTDLNPGTLHHFRVVTENEAGSSDFSGEFSGTTLGVKAPETIFQKPVFISKIIPAKDAFLRFMAWKLSATLEIYDGLGRRVRDLPPANYFYRLRYDSKSNSGTFVLVR
ncbi:MAG: fibronectin type III domain-containing protein [Spirochaetia bacterium]|nr:fibronectin type III domain-containing protein [Spirochaetia bacterium]